MSAQSLPAAVGVGGDAVKSDESIEVDSMQRLNECRYVSAIHTVNLDEK